MARHTAKSKSAKAYKVSSKIGHDNMSMARHIAKQKRTKDYGLERNKVVATRARVGGPEPLKLGSYSCRPPFTVASVCCSVLTSVSRYRNCLCSLLPASHSFFSSASRCRSSLNLFMGVVHSTPVHTSDRSPSRSSRSPDIHHH